MIIPKCTMCGKNMDLNVDNIIGLTDDGAIIYAHNRCVEIGYSLGFDYENESIKNLISYTKSNVC